MKRYIFECMHVDCIRNHDKYRFEIYTYRQVRKLFKEHSEALHICRYNQLESKNE